MIHEIDKLTPLIDDLKYYEQIAESLERGKTITIHLDNGTECLLNEEMRDRVQKDFHSIVAVEVKNLQKKIARALRGLNG